MKHPQPTRRHFLAAAAAFGTLTALDAQQPAPDDQVSAAILAHDLARPQFHLLPARNWMNDPNGPIYAHGQYHMFFQYNPHAAIWGDMSWYHSVSPDMLHWKHRPLAIAPTPGSADAYGCFSGSALQVGKRVYFIYTGTRLSSRELATLRDGEDKIQELQCLAYSDDPELLTWTKLPAPVIPSPPAGMNITGFRDPSMWKQGHLYYMTVGSGVALEGGCVLLYRSHDLKQWEYLHPLVSGQWNGKHTANPCDDGEMWECPEFFPLGDAHVLIYSTLGKVFWQSGSFDTQALTFHPTRKGELDLGAFYAPKTQLDAHGRRILWGWIQERRPDAAMIAAGWSGLMSLPRLMTLDPDGTLRLRFLPETASLRAEPLQAPAALAAASGELLCEGAPHQAFELTLRAGEQELLRAIYSPETHAFTLDGRAVPLQPGDRPTLHAFVDASVLEVIVGQRVGLTKRFYPTGATAPDITIRTESKAPLQLAGWKVAPISNNRLTSRA